MTTQTLSPIGFADLGIGTPDQLMAIVARSVGQECVDRTDLVIAEVPYDLPALTTQGRYRVSGTASRGDATWPVSIFVKVVESWTRSPVFASVPVELRALAAAGLPWQVEPLVYRSRLADALPPGLRMPSAYAVIDLDAESAAIWLADIKARTISWTYQQYAWAATLLGRFAARPAVADALEPLRPVVGDGVVRAYVNGRVAHQLLPALRSDDLWRHPLVHTYFGRLQGRLLRLADGLADLVTELEGLPAGVSHGDACTRNLLVTAGPDELVLIDFGIVRYAPLGLDLSQLVFGQIQLGERTGDDLERLWEHCVSGYLRGLQLERAEATTTQVRRAAAICAAVFAGISAIPLEHVDQPPDDRVRSIFAARSTAAEFILDQLER